MPNEIFEKLVWDWNKCDPQVAVQDRRDRVRRLAVTAAGVEHNFNRLAVASCAFLPRVGSRREVLDTLAAYPPNTPLSSFVENQENKGHFQVIPLLHFLG